MFRKVVLMIVVVLSVFFVGCADTDKPAPDEPTMDTLTAENATQEIDQEQTPINYDDAVAWLLYGFDDDGLWVCIDEKGNVINELDATSEEGTNLSLLYDYGFGEFSEGVGWAQEPDSYDYYLIDQGGNFLFSVDGADPETNYANGISLLDNYSLINKNGEIVKSLT